jgi:group II intron reverse transcriptase/maturase
MKEPKQTARLAVMRPMGKAVSATLWQRVAVVHRESCGKVSQLWLSACTSERALTSQLMERVVEPSNLMRSYHKVVGNGGSAGVDSMGVKELKGWLRANYDRLKEQLLNGGYRPCAVRKVEIPKANGGKRMLGIPTVIDRLIQQAIAQVLTPRYEEVFSAHSYGFRPNRNAHQALEAAGSYVAAGKQYVVDLDLEKFFDEVNHDRLMWLLSRRVGDKRLLKLIRRYLQSGMMEGGLVSQRIKGTPQGSPLSPLLSNIVLDELDKELERRNLSYVRYADDVKIFVSSAAAAERVKRKLTGYITGKLRLKVNEQKSKVCLCYELNFLGHSILRDGSLGLSGPSERRLRQKVKQIIRRNRAVNLVQMLKELHVVLKGWLQYFGRARMRKKIEGIDGWIRRRLRCLRLKQCKRTIGIVRWLRSLGMQETRCWLTALSGKGWWRLSNSPAVNEAMSKEWFVRQGYYSLSAHYNR